MTGPYLRAAPKAELYVHLEGAIRPPTVRELAWRNDIVLPESTLDGLRDWFRFRDFRHFIEVYGVVSRCLRTAADFELVAYELAAELARQNCRYAEVGFTPAFHAREGTAETAYLRGLASARARARKALG